MLNSPDAQHTTHKLTKRFIHFLTPTHTHPTHFFFVFTVMLSKEEEKNIMICRITETLNNVNMKTSEKQCDGNDKRHDENGNSLCE